MSYQAKRKSVYTEEFELAEENGKVVRTLHVALDPDSIIAKISEKHVDLVKALEDVRKVKETAGEEEKARGLEVLGNAVIDLLEAVFGKDDAKIIADFYENRYVEMCREVVPFITGDVIPKVRKMAQQNRRQVMSGYLRRRKTFFGMPNL